MNLEKTDTSQYILDTSKEYAIYVASNRAIPKITDGLKDAQRKALWLLRNKNDKIKTISLAGEMISSNLYVHGESSASGAVSLMAAPYCNNLPLIEGIGTFGTRIAPVEGIAAPRYTYLKKSKITQELIYKDLDIVPTKENYDGSALEPDTFLPLIPTVLLNGISGIAIGWSTEILPRSFKDIVDATLKALEGEKIKKLNPKYEYLKTNVKMLDDNIWEFEGKLEIEDSSTVRILELPPDLNLEKFKERLNNLEDSEEINGYTDSSTDTINIEVKFKRGSLKDKTEENLIDFFKLRQRKTERIVVIDWNGASIKQYSSAEELIEKFVSWRLNWFYTRYQKMLADDEHELSYWECIKLCFDNNLPENLKNFKSKKQLTDWISSITNVEEFSDKISALPSYKWVQEEYQEVLKKIKELNSNIKYYKKLLKSPDDIKGIYKQELLELKKIVK